VAKREASLSELGQSTLQLCDLLLSSSQQHHFQLVFLDQGTNGIESFLAVSLPLSEMHSSCSPELWKWRQLGASRPAASSSNLFCKLDQA
jgi:hypothetical protein